MDRSGNFGRQAALLACVLIYVASAAITLFVFVKRRIPWWEAAWRGGVIGFILFFLLREGYQAPQELGSLDVVGVALYVVGSYLGTASEYARHVWKGRPENHGHLYTEGLFRHCRHINYFGDLFVFGGCAVLSRHLWAAIVPLAMGLNSALVLIPASRWVSGQYCTKCALLSTPSDQPQIQPAVRRLRRWILTYYRYRSTVTVIQSR